MTDIIAREVVANILVHRDFSSAFPAKLIIEKDWLKTENWCRPRRHGNILQDEFSPYPENPLKFGDYYYEIANNNVRLFSCYLC